MKQVVPVNYQDTFRTTCKQGDRLSIINSKLEKSWLSEALNGACRRGHKELVELMIIKGVNDWDYGLCRACRGGHKDIADLLVAKGANDWSGGLIYACMKGHKDLVELMIQRSDDERNNQYQFPYKIYLIETIIRADDYDNGLYQARIRGHREIVELMIANGATKCYCTKPISAH